MPSFRLPAGDYEFPFEIPLDENMHETIKGPGHEYHSYQVVAVIERRLNKDIVVSEDVRIHRAIAVGPNDLLMSDPAVTEHHCKDMQYSISIPNINIPFGSTFPVKFWMAPLYKGLKMKAISIEIVENHQIKIQAPASYESQYGIRFLTSKKHRTIFLERYEQDAYEVEGLGIYDIEWGTTENVSLPKSLNACTQHVKSNTITIDHELCFTIELRHEDGHQSTIRGALPFNIVISQQPISPNNTIRGFNLEDFEYDCNLPPPLYGDHKTDSVLSEHSQGPDDLSECLAGILPNSVHSSSLPCYDVALGCVPSYEIAMRTPHIVGD